jgi:hypothetical protein
MSASARFYQMQADNCAAAAATAMLDNQRETLLRSQAAWQQLAAREVKVSLARIERERSSKDKDTHG